MPEPDPYSAFDRITTRCPRLGGEVAFGYCRRQNDPLPCRRALACFEAKFPAAEYFRLVLKPETWQKCFAGPEEGRLERLFQAVEAAQAGQE